ncbi:PD-(D/E)XK motif protein [Cryobacterium sp. PH31-L1]|uniref:PD-(D/E)XK motif protein n=1 Tax=Cryobacterium sp. PH31-L1 TaxID=3046199 RepID=UPI0024BB681A|nr:PD-(D/E)XK motif protein [Cryobacterium sp. PH31-L1]MDJ0378491.1 PD-(D/E)XK motif protein [Cryobacterium sp. PH31-L1]
MSDRSGGEDLLHLSPETVEAYFTAGVQSAFTLDGRVSARLEIDPQHEQMRLLCPAVGSDPDVISYERISFDRVGILGAPGEWFELVVDASGMHYEAYVLLESVVDQLRGGASFRHAVSESLSGLKDLLASRKRMSEAVITGLVGELLLLRHIISERGDEAALAAWLGPLAEEHDFALEEFEAEVKTTQSEGRIHLIGSETQLLPTPGRPLYLISVQLTRAGAAADSFTLPELIDAVRASIDVSRLRTFDKHLESLAWHHADADLYSVRYQQRSVPQAYLVDGEFPALTTPRLNEVVPQRALVSGVTYRVDVSTLHPTQPPAPLATFCEDTE